MIFDCSLRLWRKRANTKKVGKQRTANDWLAANMEQTTRFSCTSCNRPLITELKFQRVPYFVLFHVDKGINAKWSSTIILNHGEYRLCGMIYFGGFHFTARIISFDNEVQYYNSLKDSMPISEGNLNDISTAILCKDPDKRMLSIVLYVLI